MTDSQPIHHTLTLVRIIVRYDRPLVENTGIQLDRISCGRHRPHPFGSTPSVNHEILSFGLKFRVYTCLKVLLTGRRCFGQFEASQELEKVKLKTKTRSHMKNHLLACYPLCLFPFTCSPTFGKTL